MYLTTLIFGANLTNIFGVFPRSAGGQKLGEGSEGSNWLGGNLRLPSRWFATWRNGIAKEPKASMSRMSMSKIGTDVLDTSTERNCIFNFFFWGKSYEQNRLQHRPYRGLWMESCSKVYHSPCKPTKLSRLRIMFHNWITSSYEMASDYSTCIYIYSIYIE